MSFNYINNNNIIIILFIKYTIKFIQINKINTINI